MTWRGIDPIADNKLSERPSQARTTSTCEQAFTAIAHADCYSTALGVHGSSTNAISNLIGGLLPQAHCLRLAALSSLSHAHCLKYGQLNQGRYLKLAASNAVSFLRLAATGSLSLARYLRLCASCSPPHARRHRLSA
ncbi:hypothetical protein Dimus_024363 [Dionaea muscipula]